MQANRKITVKCNICNYTFPCYAHHLKPTLCGSDGCEKCYLNSLPLGKEEFVKRSNEIEQKKVYRYMIIVKSNMLIMTHMLKSYVSNARKVSGKLPMVTLVVAVASCTSSKGEQRIRKYLDDNKIKHESQWQLNRLRFDFKLSEYNAYIEFDGEQHFRPIKHFGGETKFKRNQKNDRKKNKYCFGRFPLLRIPYTEYENIEQILEEFIEDLQEWACNDVEINNLLALSIKSEPPNEDIEERLLSIQGHLERSNSRMLALLECATVRVKLYCKLFMPEY